MDALLDEGVLTPRLPPELIDAKAPSLTFGEVNVHRDRIGAMLKTNNATTVWQRLRDEHGLTVSVISFRRYVWSSSRTRCPPMTLRCCAPDVEAGSEAQIGYGYLALWLDPGSGRSRKLNAFVMVLAMCRHMFIRAVLAMDKRPGSTRTSPRSSSSAGPPPV